MKKSLYMLFFISFFLFIPFKAYASGGYEIENYDIKVEVFENHVLDVTENIKVIFTDSSKHGIIRSIPYKNSYKRIVNGDFVTTKEKTIIKDILVNEKYTKSKENGNILLKIGDSSTTVDTYKEYNYIIKYKYDMGDDLIEEYDDLYFNLIGTEWDTYIKSVNFEVKMPKTFDETKVSFTSGRYGSTDYEKVNYNVNDKVITGSIRKNYDIALNSYEGLTLRIELPEGYYKGERVNHDYTGIISVTILSFSIILIIISIILFRKYSYSKKDLLVPKFVIPDNLSSAEIGYLYKGMTTNEQIVSLITYFANKGYLQIIEDGKKKFKLKRLKDNEFVKNNEKDYAYITFEGLFKKADKEGVVKSSSLTNTFYKTLTKALNKLSKTHKIYNDSHYVVAFYYIFVIFISLFTNIMAQAIYSYKINQEYFIINMLNIMIAGISIVINLIFLLLNRKRCTEAKKYYEETRGFKDYLENVHKDKIEELVEKNPNIFYEILPYAYVLGVSNKWSKKFESIALTPPDWYTGNYTVFNTVVFNNSLNQTLAKATTAMSSRPYESGSGGGSLGGGGGFSGGGGGGGGGSSW